MLTAERALPADGAAERLRELLASRSDQWAREMANVRGVLTRGDNG